MSPDRWGEVKRVFLHAAPLSPVQRAAYLAIACRDRPDLLAQVESLLIGEASAPDYMNSPEDAIGKILPLHNNLSSLAHRTTRTAPNLTRGAESPPLPTMIGSCRIISVLGEGASGLVYLAEQARPRRHVALKVVLPGQTTAAGLRRLEREAEIMARMRHPGIAQVIESGVEHGGPYFVMEYVKGDPITQFSRERDLSIPARLRLFLLVCDAVQHAHSMGVIHRDLKPANILVTDAGAPKILDFGVARAIDADPRQATIATSLGQLVGTLAYMSPEQAGGDAGSIDIRADVYALGGILHELLAGHPPLDVAGKPLHEALRIIQQVPAPRLGAICRACRGDLETIAAKALEKEPGRRYASVSELAGDVRRHLDRLPIHARPPSPLYEAIRFTERHRPLVAGVAIALTSIIGALGWSLVERYREHQNYLLAKSVAGSWLGEVMYTLQPVQGSHHARRRMIGEVRSPLERFAERHPNDPDAQGNLAALSFAMGNLESETGRFEEAMRHYARAYHILNHLGDHHPVKLRWRLDQSIAAVRIGDILNAWGRGEETHDWYMAALALDISTVRRFPYNYTANDQLLWSYDRLALTSLARGHLGTARRWVDVARPLAARIVRTWPDSPKALWCEISALETAAALEYRLGEAESSLATTRRALELRRGLIIKDPSNRGYQLKQIEALAGLASQHITCAEVATSVSGTIAELRSAEDLLNEARPMMERALLSEAHEPAVHAVAHSFYMQSRRLHGLRREQPRARHDSELAVAHAARASALDPSSLDAANSHAWAMFYETSYFDSIADTCETARLECCVRDVIAGMIARFPTRPEPYWLLAHLSLRSPSSPMFDPSLVSLAARRAAEFSDPADPRVQQTLAGILKEIGDFQGAHEACRLALQLVDSPADPRRAPIEEQTHAIEISVHHAATHATTE